MQTVREPAREVGHVKLKHQIYAVAAVDACFAGPLITGSVQNKPRDGSDEALVRPTCALTPGVHCCIIMGCLCTC